MARSVLVVDDAAFMRMMIRDILAREGYMIHEAVNGRDAVEKYAELKPDLVTMDITMPEMSGLDALRAIREKDPQARVLMVSAMGQQKMIVEALQAIRDHDPDARVLMVSAMGQQKMIVEALESGAMDFLVKPFQPAKVLETVKKCLQSAAR